MPANEREHDEKKEEISRMDHIIGGGKNNTNTHLLETNDALVQIINECLVLAERFSPSSVHTARTHTHTYSTVFKFI